MSRRKKIAIMAVTIAGWLALLANASPFLELDDGARALAAAVSMCGTIVLTVLYVSQPVLEVYNLGRAAGRREEKIAAATTKNVVPLRARRDGSGLSRLG